METIISLIQILIAVLLIASILFQQRGSGLSSAFGGGGGVYYQKRGMEKVLLRVSIGLALAFVSIALLRLFL